MSAGVIDVLIAGAGATGLALAAALKQGLGEGARIAVADITPPARDDRAVAIAEGPRNLIDRLGAWAQIAPLAQPILRMNIFDGEVDDAVRVPHLHFEGTSEQPLAHMAFLGDVEAALRQAAAHWGVERIEGRVNRLVVGAHSIEVETDAGSRRARLLVAADGADSKLRAHADISTYGRDYDQLGLVATIDHEREHGGVAEQHFLPAGPFARLPLSGRRSSIVWTEPRGEAEDLLALDADDALRALERRFTAKLGAIRFASPLRGFPLGLKIARRFIAPRFALVGDAAHRVHPLAGQGLNLGFRDVAALAERVVERMRLGLDPGDAATLEAYQRDRRFDVAASGLGMDVMNKVFSNDFAPLRFLRDLGLRLVDRAPMLKTALVGEAGGAMRTAPRLLRGLGL